jgi:hypothetical protein
MPNNSVNDLINIFSKMSGFQRSNRFEVTITPPKGLQLPNVPLFASAVQIPSHIINHYKDTMAPSGGYIDVPLRRQYDERFVIDFIVDTNWQVRKFFDAWTDLIFPDRLASKNSLMVNYWSNVVGTILVKPLNENGDAVKTIQLNGAWPGTVIASQFGHDVPDAYLTLQVDINYRNYTLY